MVLFLPIDRFINDHSFNIKEWRMAKILGYIASSLDGFIATDEDSLDWLFAYNNLDLGEYDYNIFIKRIRTVVMGRGTYDFLAKDSSPWAYGDQRVLVLTSRAIAAPKGELELRDNIDDLITELRSLNDGDVWVLGGGQLQMAFIERCALDEIEIYMMPELIGGGKPLFPPTGFRERLRLIQASALDQGCVRLHYAFNHTAESGSVAVDGGV
jgi:dihydrofolate reductase